MEFNYNSISAKVYRNFYETSNMPESLCPYFWKLVVAWTITILFLPLLIPGLIIDNINRDSNDRRLPFPVQVFMGFFIYIAVFLAFCVIISISSMWTTYYEGTPQFVWYGIGNAVIGLLLIIAVILIIKHVLDKRREKRKELEYDENGNYIIKDNENKSNIFIEFIKAKYNKYCPKIDWK